MKERNPYLRRTNSNQERHHSYDMSTNKHFIIELNGKEVPIQKTGAYPPVFKAAFSGFASYKQRYLHPQHMHFVPEYHTSFHTPTTDKFAGYAQFPYQLKALPSHLNNKRKFSMQGEDFKQPLNKPLTKSFNASFNQCSKASTQRDLLKESNILSTMNKRNPQFLQMSFNNITMSKPLPKQKKKTCYNNKCRDLKYFVKQFAGNHLTTIKNNTMATTMGQSHFQSNLAQEKQESMLMSTMVG